MCLAHPYRRVASEAYSWEASGDNHSKAYFTICSAAILRLAEQHAKTLSVDDFDVLSKLSTSEFQTAVRAWFTTVPNSVMEHYENSEYDVHKRIVSELKSQLDVDMSGTREERERQMAQYGITTGLCPDQYGIVACRDRAYWRGRDVAVPSSLSVVDQYWSAPRDWLWVAARW